MYCVAYSQPGELHSSREDSSSGSGVRRGRPRLRFSEPPAEAGAGAGRLRREGGLSFLEERVPNRDAAPFEF